MPVSDIKEIRLLPPLAIGRFGGSAEPMHNYEAVIGSPTGFRDLVPAETLLLNPNSGEIVAKLTPPAVRFKDGAGLVKPVCPFLEVWARFDNEPELRQLTKQELDDLGLTPQAVVWDVTFGNLKILRRTGEPADRVTAAIAGIADHQRRSLDGQCPNFKNNRTVPMGWVQYVKPNAAFPEIRFRFTPPAGLVYGHKPDAVIPAQNAVYDSTRGTWDTHTDGAVPTGAPDPRAHKSTIPPGIYAINPTTRKNLGYLDDSSDGIITVTLTLRDGRRLSSFARASAGPPDFAPDSQPVRSMGDELEQLVLGPTVQDVTVEEVLDIVRRALETMRLMDTGGLNLRYAGGAFGPGDAAYRMAHDIHSSLLATLEKGLKAPAGSADRSNAHGTLMQINSVVREFDAVADMRTVARRRMPALMRGADSNDLALNRRQRNKLSKALDVFKPAPSGAGTEVAAMTRMIAAFQAMAGLHAGFSEDNRSLADRFADPAAVLDYLRKAVAKGAVAAAAGLAGQPLVIAGELRLSAHHLTAPASHESAALVVSRHGHRKVGTGSGSRLDNVIGTRSVTHGRHSSKEPHGAVRLPCCGQSAEHPAA